MLVKFLSYVITVFGTKRYKPFLLACSALIFSLAGISVVTAMSSTSDNSAARATSQEDNGQRSAIQAQTPSKRSTRADETVSTPGSTPATTTEPQATTAPQTSPTKPSSPELTVNTNTITVSKAATTAAELTAAISDGSSVQWTLTADKPGLQFNPAALATGAKTTVAISPSPDAAPQTYRLTLQATDSAKNISLTKIITVTVTD